MARTAPVPAAEFTRNFGRYRMLAQKGAVAVSSHGRITGYFVPAVEFEEYQRFRATRRSFAVSELPDETVGAIARTRMSKRHNHLNKLLDSK